MHLENHITHKSGSMKTVCTSAVLAHFGISPSEYHYSSCSEDVKRILRAKGYSVRSRKSALKVRPGTTIGQLRKALRAHDGSPHSRYYVGVRGHAMMLKGNGDTVVDTDPRKRDVRKVQHVAIVERKSGKPEIRVVDLTDAQVEIFIQAKRAGQDPVEAIKKC